MSLDKVHLDADHLASFTRYLSLIHTRQCLDLNKIKKNTRLIYQIDTNKSKVSNPKNVAWSVSGKRFNKLGLSWAKLSSSWD